MKVKANHDNIKEKMEALRKVMISLDRMSTVRETSFTIIRG
jgi:hypothetical protein